MSRSFKTQAVICLLLAALLCFSPAVSAASWTTLLPADHILKTYYEGNYNYVVYDFHRTPYISYSHGGKSGSNMSYATIDSVAGSAQKWTFQAYPLGVMCVAGPPLTSSGSGMIAIDVSDFKSNAALSLFSNLNLDLKLTETSSTEDYLTERVSIITNWYFFGYKENGSYSGNIEHEYVASSIILQDVAQESFVLEVPLNHDLLFSEFSADVRYVVSSCKVEIAVVDDQAGINIERVRFAIDDFTITARTDMLLKESLTLEAIEDELGGLNDKLDDTNQKLDDIMQQPQNEKEEATQEGDKFVNQLTGVIPNDNQGFMNAITQLASSMSYEGTESKLTLPSISLPAIPGVMKGYKLTEAQEVDFGFWIQKIPDKILTLVQVLGTLGLIVYSFKELYGLISYAMTLKGGKSDG